MEQLIDVRKVFYLNCIGREDLPHGRLRKHALSDNRIDDADESVIQRRLDSRFLIENRNPAAVRSQPLMRDRRNSRSASGLIYHPQHNSYERATVIP